MIWHRDWQSRGDPGVDVPSSNFDITLGAFVDRLGTALLTMILPELGKLVVARRDLMSVRADLLSIIVGFLSDWQCTSPNQPLSP